MSNITETAALKSQGQVGLKQERMEVEEVLEVRSWGNV
jgi:hypothetical protein